MAQKIHACTDPLSDGRLNTRTRDLVDLQLLEPLLVDVADLVAVRAACLEVFELRGRHRWPPDLQAYDGWLQLYATAVDGLEDAIVNGVVAGELPDALDRVRDLIDRIHAVDHTRTA